MRERQREHPSNPARSSAGLGDLPVYQRPQRDTAPYVDPSDYSLSCVCDNLSATSPSPLVPQQDAWYFGRAQGSMRQHVESRHLGSKKEPRSHNLQQNPGWTFCPGRFSRRTGMNLQPHQCHALSFLDPSDECQKRFRPGRRWPRIRGTCDSLHCSYSHSRLEGS